MSIKINTYEQAIEKLIFLAREADLFGETSRAVEIENAAGKLTEWLEAGQPDSCPIDLTAYDIEVGQVEGADLGEGKIGQEAITENGGFPLADTVVESEGIAPDVKKRKITSAEIDQTQAAEVKSRVEGPDTKRRTRNPRIGDRSQLQMQGEDVSTPGDRGKQSVQAVQTPEGTIIKELEEDLESTPLPPKIETPEQLDLRRQIAAARQYLEAGQLREAAALSKSVIDHAGDMADVRETARDLSDQVQRRLNDKLNKILMEGDRARREEKEEAARKFYKTARDLDPENDHAQRALLELDNALVTSLSKDEVFKLKMRLKERQNIQVLREAVYLAEALDKEDKLPAVLIDFLKAAREAYNAQRMAHGEETTMMRFGDLDARKRARDEFKKHVAIGDELIFDITHNETRPAADLLREADRLYEERSEDTAQYVLSLVNLLLPGHPRAASEHISESLKKPFFEQHKRILIEKMVEVEKLLRGQETAEALLVQAHQESDALKILNMVVQAKAAFADLPGIQERLDAARRTALETLAAGITHHNSQAETHVRNAGFFSGKEKYKFFKQARTEVTAGKELLAQWPEQAKPKELLDLAKIGDQILIRIEEQEALTGEFEGRVETILNKITDDGTRGVGMTMFAELRADPRFAKYPDLHVLNEMMDQYRDVQTRLDEAELARQARDWQRTFKLAKEIYDSGKAGQWLGRVEALRNEAEVELSIQEAQQALEKDHFQDANRILSRLIKNVSSELGESLKSRLKSELAKIDQAIADNPPMQILYDQAMTIKDSPNTEYRLQAMRLLRYIAGEPTETRQEGWLVYRLSLRTADARREARELGERLRQEWLPPVETAYANRNTKSPAEDELRTLAERARWLRETNLIQNEEQRKAVRWAEMKAEFQRVAELEKSGAWDDVVKILFDLNINYPRHPELEGLLHNARVQKLAAEIQTMISGGQVEKAIEWITQGDINENLRNTPQIMLVLAEAQAEQGDFARSFGTLIQAEKRFLSAQKAIRQKETELRALQAWRVNKPEAWDIEKTDQGKSEWSINGPAQALGIIQQAIEEGDYVNADVLKKIQREYFERTREYLIERAGRMQNEATQTGKVDAVIALLDLRRLEDILHLAQEKRESTRRVRSLTDSFVEVGRALIERANKFEDQESLPIEDALDETEQLHSHMQAILDALTAFKVNLGRQGIDLIHKQVGDVESLREKFLRSKKLLDKVSDDDIWDSALRSGDFNQLDQIDKKLESMDVAFINEVKNFYNKLKEWEEIHNALAESISKIGKYFSEGDFENTLKVLDETKNLPQRRNDGSVWNTITARQVKAGKKIPSQAGQTGYQHIRQVMGVCLSLQDIYGDQELVGWGNVENTARQRLLEGGAWAAWNSECSKLMEHMGFVGSKTKTHRPDTQLGPMLQDWEALRDIAEEAVRVLREGPILDTGDKTKVSSKKAKALNEEGKRNLESALKSLDYAKRKIEEIQKEIKDIGGFPTPQNYKDATAQNDWQRLYRLLQQAQRIGFSNQQDQKRTETYQRIYDERTAQSQSRDGGGFLSRIKDAFRRS